MITKDVVSLSKLSILLEHSETLTSCEVCLHFFYITAAPASTSPSRFSVCRLAAARQLLM